MKHTLLLVFTLIGLLITNAALAVRVTTIYQAEIPVASQLATTRNQLLPQALGQVLVKVTGNTKILDNPTLSSHLKEASTLVQEYGYKASNDSIKPYLLTIQFDPEGINKLLNAAALPTWGANRPLILAWVDYEVPNHSAEIIDSSSSNDIQKILRQRADQRGLPIILPVMDVTDLNQVAVNDIVSMTTAKLQSAAKRYSSDAILMLRMMRVTDGFTAQAKLVLDTNEWSWNISGKTLAEVLNTLVDNMTDTLSSRYSTVVTNTIQSTLTLKISGVSQQDDFANMMHYIQHLTPVASAQVMQITGSDVILNVSLHGTRESFSQIISVGKKLTPVPAESNDKMLVYQWNH